MSEAQDLKEYAEFLPEDTGLPIAIETKVEGTTGIVELVFSNGSSLTLSYRLV